MTDLLRFSTYAGVSAAALGSAVGLAASPWFAIPLLSFGGLAALGTWDLTQRRHAILRNYPVLGHMRFMFEGVRPEIRQYLIESDADEEPFSREVRSLVYQRAKGEEDKRPFGTRRRVYDSGHEWLTHSASPRTLTDTDFRITVGGRDCRQPYAISVFNISAMSFGALSAQAVLAMGRGAKAGGFAQDTGEGGISRHHRAAGADLIWEIGSGYFGCRTSEGRFDPDRFASQAADPQIKMIEMKISQGAKPGHGGMLPAAKISPEIADARGVPMGVDCVSPVAHPEWCTPPELMHFIARLRELSEGKPVGFKLCIGHRREFMCMVRAMLETGITPDFIVIDGAEGGTGAAPVEFADHLGMPLVEGLSFAHNTLRGAGLRDRVKIGASGKLVTSFAILKALAIGADWANSARGFMFATGCIQAQSCHTNRCPVGVATQDPSRARAIDVPDKAERVRRFHANTLLAIAEMTGAAGLSHPGEFRPHHLIVRESDRDITTGDEVWPHLPDGFLLETDTNLPDPFGYRMRWARSRAESFEPFDVA